MNTEDLLLLFDESHPCWTSRMFELAGQDVSASESLLREGVLQKENDVYCLTSAGAERFRQVAEESFLPLRAGVAEPGADKNREADRSLLQQLLDKRHLQRWGLKEYCRPFRFEIPDLKGNELFTFEGGKPNWHYPDNSAFGQMQKDFPATGMAARTEPAPDAARVAEWMASFMPKRRTVTADLLYKSRYDFQAYAHFPKLSADPCDMLNADRFFCFFAPPPAPENVNAMLTTLGEYQMYLTMLRHMYLPGYVDRDSLDQDGINWLIYVYAREEDALRCADLLSPFGQSLAGPAAPMEIWSLSLQALYEHEGTGESVFDLLPFVARPILRIV